MGTQTILEPTELLVRVLAGGLKVLSDDELERLARYVEVPETEGDPVRPLGLGGYAMHLATRQERQLRRGEHIGNVATCFASLAARWMLAARQSVD